ncbi:MAG: dethiobiotin synthase [Verrucomicrobiota bacterium]|nr:dethiobiotin synthase [Limisphaera sp.]MDW8382180.1 dethiobiotin synthase [Verrucomicrobiota bacterium]
MLVFVTGSDTGVGKTVVSMAWTHYLHHAGRKVAALKPISSGGRADARLLWEAAGRSLPLDVVNPWWFRPAIAPTAAAQKSGTTLPLARVVDHVRRVAAQFDILLIEGAGGLLSPLGSDFDNLDLLQALRAKAVVVIPNRLGAVNQLRLVKNALDQAGVRAVQYVLVNQPHRSSAVRTHSCLLARYLSDERLYIFPFLRSGLNLASALPPMVRRVLQRLSETTGVMPLQSNRLQPMS